MRVNAELLEVLRAMRAEAMVVIATDNMDCFARAFQNARHSRRRRVQPWGTLADWAVICDDVICSSDVSEIIGAPLGPPPVPSRRASRHQQPPGAAGQHGSAKASSGLSRQDSLAKPAGGMYAEEDQRPDEGDGDDGELHTPAEAPKVLKVRESWLREKATARATPRTFAGKHLRLSDDNIQRVDHPLAPAPGGLHQARRSSATAITHPCTRGRTRRAAPGPR